MVSKQHGPIEDDKIDQLKVYQEKLSRWKHGTFIGTKTYEFWVLMRMSKAAKEPLQHLLHFLEKDVLDARGSTHLSLLVCGKANDMLLELMLCLMIRLGRLVLYLHHQIPTSSTLINTCVPL